MSFARAVLRVANFDVRTFTDWFDFGILEPFFPFTTAIIEHRHRGKICLERTLEIQAGCTADGALYVQ